MNDQLEDTSFDVIVIGTGLVESIAAGSLARSGKKVLHLDSNKHYGSNWSVFNFKGLLDWEKQLKSVTPESTTQENGIDYAASYSRQFKNVEILLGQQQEPSTTLEQLRSIVSATDYEHYIQPREHDDVGQLANLAQGLKDSRHYNLDTVPKILPSRGNLVDILIRSGVGRYMEFKSVDDMFVFDHASHSFEKVPGSKEDIFVNKSISLVDKRKLMKFLKFTVDEEKDMELLKGYESMTYEQFLEDRFKITGKLQKAVIHAISLSRSDVTAEQGLERTQSFMKSMGRFGKGAYLCTLYGGGSEISQAFCRICAVYGGVYILGQSLDKYTLNEETGQCTGVVTKDGQVFTASHIITGLDYLSPQWNISSVNDGHASWVSRAMIVTDKPPSQLDQSGTKQSLGISVIPPNVSIGNANELIYVLNQSSETMACPKDQAVTYLWTPTDDPSKESILKNVTPLLLEPQSEDSSARILFEVYYNQRIRSAAQLDQDKIPSNVYVCSDPDVSLDFEQATREAKAIFYRCVDPDVEFMPPADDPNDD
ncbi:GDP dissociation inhibitor [Chlamydoabsidia padenii]|nr:GDP dissociation inhibitor [Chlamydoabsidia padenii]